MVPFAGWNMPIQYRGVIEEHLCVRERVGIFDVSHMGEIEIRGKDAALFLQSLITNDLEKMTDGSILYTLMCYEHGGVVDDLLVHRFSPDHYLLCVNASNQDKDYEWIQNHSGPFQAEVENTGPRTAQLAVQGPHAEILLQPMADSFLGDIQYYHFRKGKIHNVDALIARTGYTGEDGFELYLPAEEAESVFREIIKRGGPYGLQPIGLGARDTLRLEMGYSLYGHEIDENTSPLEAGLGWVVKLGKERFVGKEALAKQKAQGPARKIVGIKLWERGVPRSHYSVTQKGSPVGEVTSGTYSPSLNTGIGLCYVSREHSALGTRLEVRIRNQGIPGEVVKPPFVPSNVKKD